MIRRSGHRNGIFADNRNLIRQMSYFRNDLQEAAPFPGARRPVGSAPEETIVRCGRFVVGGIFTAPPLLMLPLL
jgi:hypothetical protein